MTKYKCVNLMHVKICRMKINTLEDPRTKTNKIKPKERERTKR